RCIGCDSATAGSANPAPTLPTSARITSRRAMPLGVAEPAAAGTTVNDRFSAMGFASPGWGRLAQTRGQVLDHLATNDSTPPRSNGIRASAVTGAVCVTGPHEAPE